MIILEGWIFDVCVSGREIAIWIIDKQGKPHRLRDKFLPSFYVGGDPKDLTALAQWLLTKPWGTIPSLTYRYDLQLNHRALVLQVQVRDPDLFATIFQRVTRRRPRLAFYNGGIPVPQMYLMEKHAFPLALCQFSIDDQDRLYGFEVHDSPWALDYALPQLKQMTIHFAGDAWHPERVKRGPLNVAVGNEVHALRQEEPTVLLETLRELLLRHDPDLIVTNWGDLIVLPYLSRLSREYKIPLPLHREPSVRALFQPPHSFYSYGLTMHRAMAQPLLGRWHVDCSSAFVAEDYGLEGAIEIARLTAMSVQDVIRTDIWKGMSPMEIATAFRKGILVPWHPWKPARRKLDPYLVCVEESGKKREPHSAIYENVAQIDLAALYPAIMTRFNLSPETVNCQCASTREVSEVGLAICQERRGLVPEAFGSLVDKRTNYARRMSEIAGERHPDKPEAKQRHELYRRRHSAQSVLLATCLDYLGSGNTRFGNIERYEAIVAYARSCLRRVEAVFEKHGLEVVEANSNSLWVSLGHFATTETSEESCIAKESRREDSSRREPLNVFARQRHPPRLDGGRVEAAVAEMTQAVGIPMALEGMYPWVLILPPYTHQQAGVIKGWVGARESGDLVMRGIETQQREAPRFVAGAQIEMLQVLGRKHSGTAIASFTDEMIDLVCEYAQALRVGMVLFEDLVVGRRLERNPRIYRRDSEFKAAVQELVSRAKANGLMPTAEDMFLYVMTTEHVPAESERLEPAQHYRRPAPYDARQYIELLRWAASLALDALGIPEERVRERVNKAKNVPVPRLARLPRRTTELLLDGPDVHERPRKRKGLFGK